MLRTMVTGPCPATHVILRNQPLGILPLLIKADKPMVLELRLLKALEHHVLLQGEVQDQSVLVSVLRDVAEITAALADRGVGKCPGPQSVTVPLLVFSKPVSP